METEPNDVLDLDAAAALFHVSPRTFRRWTAAGKVPKIDSPGRQLLYSRKQLYEAFPQLLEALHAEE